MEKQKVRKPKAKKVRSNYFMSPRDRDLVLAACSTIGESRSEFLRIACRERALRILAGQDPLVRNQ